MNGDPELPASESGGRMAGRFALALLTVALAAGLLVTIRPDNWGDEPDVAGAAKPTPTARPAVRPASPASAETLFLVTSDADAGTIGRAIESGYFAGGAILQVPAAADSFEIEALIASANAFRTRPGPAPLVVDMRVR